jgi:hypothetical protein
LNDFLWKITIENYERWVDIEIEYYKSLINIINRNDVDNILKELKRKQIYDNKTEEIKGKSRDDVLGILKRKLIDRLNSEFSIIRNALIHYLNEQSKAVIKDNEICKNIFETPKTEMFKNKPENKTIEKYLFLSFNYTETERLYSEEGMLINHIHGQLNNSNNPIIFGYGGDETDENYMKLKKEYDTKYLKYIKTFNYNETWYYSSLMDFIESNQYEVYIMGHSCGVSDKALLKLIFLHPKCLSIKICYHQKYNSDDYFELKGNILKICDDDKRINDIIVPHRWSYPLKPC